MTNDELIKKAKSVVNPRQLGKNSAGSVGCALLTDNGNVYLGVCIDTRCGMGFCAEHSAAAAMITAGEIHIDKIVAVSISDEGTTFVLPPCGRCREFLRQINEHNLETNVIIAKDKVIKLKELLPYHDWKQNPIL